MEGALTQTIVVPDGEGSVTAASETELRAWVEGVTGAVSSDWRPISGGNRCRSWAVHLSSASGERSAVYVRYQPPRPPSTEPYTVWREARVYEALGRSAVRAPRLLAVHPTHQAIVTELAPGRADYRGLRDRTDRETIVHEFVAELARLHRSGLTMDRAGSGTMRIADAVRAELDVWSRMYRETGARDPLIEFSFDWLARHLPDPAEPAVLVHGDAGPGNFLFEDGRLTALLDWELAHVGDPMEDLAWFSMRSVMEPVPDFAAALRWYEEAGGARIDLARIRYHRVFVSLRVVVIRHRNVTGLAGNSIVSRALNRRLLVEALGEASGVELASVSPIDAQDTPVTGLYDGVLADLRTDIAEPSGEAGVVSAAKNVAKVVKYLREVDRLGHAAGIRAERALQDVLGHDSSDPRAAQDTLLDALADGRIPFDAALRYFNAVVADEAQLAALASGGLARRHLPALQSPAGPS